MAKESTEINSNLLQEWTETVASTHTGEWAKGIKTATGSCSPISRIGERFTLMQVATRVQVGATITACVKCTFKKTTCIIGYVHSEALILELPGLLSEKDWLAKYGGEDTDDIEPVAFRHCHIVHGHSYSSQDGQYIGRFTTWEKFMDIYQHEDTSPIVEEASKLMARLMNAKRLSFQVDICYPEHFKHRREYEDSINVSRVSNKLFGVCWILDNYSQWIEIVPSHINLNYAAVIMNDWMHDEFLKYFGKLNAEKMCNILYVRYTRIKEIKYNIFKMGQKIIPMSIEEYINPWSICQSFWRELFIGLACTELVFNGCCLGFPMIVGWTQVDGAHAGIFENASLHERYQHGEIAAKMAKELRRVEEMAKPFSIYSTPQHAGYADKIKDAINYGETALVMSNSAGLIIYEDVGPTLANWHNYVESPRLIAYGYVEVLMWPNAARIVADWLTSFVALHERMGCIHGDLHMNNMTIDFSSISAKLHGNMFAYILGGLMYLFPDDGARGYFIDSSKSVLINMAPLRRSLPQADVAKYERGLPSLLAKFLCTYFPQYEKREDEITQYASRFPVAMQSIAEAVDLNNLGKNIAHFSSYGAMKTAPEFIKIGHSMVEMAAVRIAQVLDDMAASTDTLGAPPEYPRIARKCMVEHFSEFLVPNREELVKRVGENFFHCVNCDIKLTRKLSEPMTAWKSCNPKLIVEICKKYGVDPPPMWEQYAKWNEVKPAKPVKKFQYQIEEWMLTE